MFNDIERAKKGNTEIYLFARCQRSGSIRDPIQARTLVLLGAASQSTWWDNEPQGTFDIIVLHMVVIFKCHTPQPVFPDYRLTLEERRKKLPLPKYIRKQEGSHLDRIGKQFTLCLQSNVPMV